MRIVCANLQESAVRYMKEQRLPVEIVNDANFDLEEWTDPRHFSAIITNLDVSGGLYMCRAIRRANKRIPIIGISSIDTAHSFSVMRSIFLENGGDDLFPAAFNYRELVASVRAVIRRDTSGEMCDVLTLTVKENIRLRVNRNLLLVTINDNNLFLTSKEYQIMTLLAQRANSIVTKEQILNYLYSFYSTGEVPEIKIVDVFVHKLRKKMSVHVADDIIHTFWGVGYGIKTESSGGTSSA